MSDPDALPLSIRIGVMARYGAGLPMMASLTVHNPSADLLYFDLPRVDWFGDPRGARWVLSTRDGHPLRAVGMGEPSLVPSDGGGFGLDPGDAVTTLIDLAALMPDIAAGHYSLHVDYPAEVSVSSPPVPLCVEPLEGLDADVARAVMHGTRGDGTWGGFFRGDWVWQERPMLEQVSPDVARALTLHLFLHRAFYGDAELAKLDLAPLDRLDEDPLEGEAALLRHEVMHAAQSPVAEQWRTYVATRWPGLVWRTAQTERGFGVLRVQRDRTQRRLAYRPQDEIDGVLRP